MTTVPRRTTGGAAGYELRVAAGLGCPAGAAIRRPAGSRGPVGRGRRAAGGSPGHLDTGPWQGAGSGGMTMGQRAAVGRLANSSQAQGLGCEYVSGGWLARAGTGRGPGVGRRGPRQVAGTAAVGAETAATGVATGRWACGGRTAWNGGRRGGASTRWGEWWQDGWRSPLVRGNSLGRKASRWGWVGTRRRGAWSISSPQVFQGWRPYGNLYRLDSLFRPASCGRGGVGVSGS